MLEAIKRAAKDAIEASNLVAVMLGTVTKTSPLEVNVDQRFTLDADFLIVPETLTPYEVNIDGVEYIIRRGLEAGDGVILLRMQGGQRYLILDRVVNGA
jgi:hypothetical protein